MEEALWKGCPTPDGLGAPELSLVLMGTFYELKGLQKWTLSPLGHGCPHMTVIMAGMTKATHRGRVITQGAVSPARRTGSGHSPQQESSLSQRSVATACVGLSGPRALGWAGLEFGRDAGTWLPWLVGESC